MKELPALMFLYAETPLHVGSGVSLGAVDLPIQRERMSRLPMIQGSGIKGAWREVFREARGDKDDVTLSLFGPAPPGDADAAASEEAEEYAGALALVDARLLLFPVRTVFGGWAWTTAPMVLQRLARDLDVATPGAPPAWRDLAPAPGKALVGSACNVTDRAVGGALIVEDLQFEAQSDERVDALAKWLGERALPSTPAYAPFRARLAGQLAVIADEDFTFLTEHATEVVARVRIAPDTGTVASGALWSEEALPAESLLWSLAFFAASRRPRKNGDQPASGNGQPLDAVELKQQFSAVAAQRQRIRLGGDRTVGRGLVGVRVLAEER